MAKKMENGSEKPNCGPDVVVEFTGRLTASLRKMREAQAEHANEVKRAKAAGIETKPLLEVLKQRRRDPEDVANEERTKARYRAWLGMPVHTQAELFSAGEDQHPSDRAQAEIGRIRAYDDGHFAGSDGHDNTLNPHVVGSELNQEWHRGWTAGQRTIADDMTAGKPARGRKGKGNPLQQDQTAA